MRKLIKKTVALTAAFAMTLSMSAVASAATGTSGDLNSDSQLEGYVDKTVYDITVPTIAEDGLDFTVDPQGLLKIADNGAGDYNIASGAVYFANSAGGFSNTSDEIKIFNNSSFAIDVSLDVTVKAKDAGITLVEQAALSGATDPSLYLGLIVDGGAAEAITADTYEGTPVTLDAVEEVTSDSNKGYMIKASDSPFPGLEDATPSPNEKYYTYALTSSYVLGTDGDSVAYKLEGACDDASTADWSNVATNVLSAQIVWSVEAEELTPLEPVPAAPSIAVDSFDYSAASGAEILVDLGAGNLAATGIASVTWANTSDGSFAAIGGYDTPDFDTETSTLTLPSGLFGGCAVGGTRAIKITFNDDANTAVILTLTKTN